MKTLLTLLFLAMGFLSFGQEPADVFEKAPPPIDEALRARLDKFYQAYVTGKYREAFALITEDSQDAYIAAPKPRYKSCETIRINWSEEFTKARVVESCEGEFTFHGQTVPVKRPTTSDWKLVDGEWYWYYVKPDAMASPFSPTGFVPIPHKETTAAAEGGAASPAKLPSQADVSALAAGILQGVKLDKTSIRLRTDQSSKDELHVRNDMPGGISFDIGQVAVAGLKITPGKTTLQEHEETTIVFEFRLDDKAIACVDCAKKIQSTVNTVLKVQPSGQAFPIDIVFANPPAQKPAK